MNIDSSLGFTWTSFFYWYDRSFANMKNTPDFPLDEFTWREQSWWNDSAQQIIDAGIDVIAPVYWGGVQADDTYWSRAGLEVMDNTFSSRVRQGLPNPAVAMFLDTSTFAPPQLLTPLDLRQASAIDAVYSEINEFFSRINPAHWLIVDDKAMVVIYNTWPFSNFGNANLFAELSERFEQEYGRGLFIIAPPEFPARADATYRWGAGLYGQYDHDVLSVSPGYDSRHLNRAGDDMLFDREGGAYFKRGFDRIESMPNSERAIVHVETWSEYYEGTEVAPTIQDGRYYLNRTARRLSRLRFPVEYIRECYRQLLGREAAATEIDWYLVNTYHTHGQREAVKQAIKGSAEYREAFAKLRGI